MFFKSKQKYEPDAVPTTVEEAIPLLGVCEDGVCLIGRNLWSKNFRFTDVNYSVASGEDKEGMFLGYSDILNSMDAGATTKITINNRRIQRSQFEKTNMIPLMGDRLDRYRNEYNAISKNLIMVNRGELLNGNSFILGVSGSGKSMLAKQDIVNLYLSDQNADIIVIDPEREYKIVEALGGERIILSATSKHHINAMDMNRDYGDGENPLTLKSEFILSLCEQLIGRLDLKQKSVIETSPPFSFPSSQNARLQGEDSQQATSNTKKKSLAVCQEAIRGSGTYGKGEYESLSKGGYDAQTRRASRNQVCKGGIQGNGGSCESLDCHSQRNNRTHHRGWLGYCFNYFGYLYGGGCDWLHDGRDVSDFLH